MPAHYCITTAIDYVNAPPHLGHAYEKVAADVMARFQRLRGKEVYFLTGTDEHGSKVAETAATKDKTPQAYADEMSEHFKLAWTTLNLKYDRFIRTTDEDHVAVVTHMWNTMLKKGDIYKDTYEGKYCTGCESFLGERDMDDEGLCLIHKKAPDIVAEENYFFRLSAYKDKLTELINTQGFVQPDFRAQEVKQMLDNIQDISVSRPTDSVSWGIPVPDDASSPSGQTIYVWIDALSNYLTGTGFLHNDDVFQQFWPADCHVIGKDISRFHALYWPAMLLSAEIPLPKCIYAHGFINLNDAKISKSLGNVIAPQDLMTRFALDNPDPIRYYLMSVCPFGQDGNFTEADFITRINADLANNVGNLLNRTLNMTKKYCDSTIPKQTGQVALDFAATEIFAAETVTPVSAADIEAIATAYNAFKFQHACELMISLVDEGNRLINRAEPWALFKAGDTEKVNQVLYNVLDRLRQVALMLSPITPELSDRILTQLGYGDDHTLRTSATWSSITDTALPAGQAIQLLGPILPRLDDELAGSDTKKAKVSA